MKRLKILKKHVLKKCLRIAFYTYIPVNLYNFLKKNIIIAVPYCTILYSFLLYCIVLIAEMAINLYGTRNFFIGK